MWESGRSKTGTKAMDGADCAKKLLKLSSSPERQIKEKEGKELVS